MRSILILTFAIILSFPLIAQVPGTWKDYVSFSNALKVADAGDRVFCATGGGVFYFDKQDNSVSKISGLSDFGIQTMEYSAENDLLLIAYSNSNIDIVRQGEVVNLSDIKRKSMTADKTIHNITFGNGEAYLSCGFGIVVLNLEKNEVKDTYFIGVNGGSVAVYDVAFFEAMIYAATENGILKAPASGSDLLDYNSWMEENGVPNSSERFTQLDAYSGRLIANYSSDSGGDLAYSFDGISWSAYNVGIYRVRDLNSTGDYLVFTGSDKISLFDPNHDNAGIVSEYVIDGENIKPISARSAVVDDDGIIWIADYNQALVRFDGSEFTSIVPNGPVSNDVFFVASYGSDLWLAPGGRSDSWNNTWMEPRFQRESAGFWTNFSKKEVPEMDGFWDIVCLAIDPKDPTHLFVGSWGGGLLEFRNDQFFKRYTNNNSPLPTALPQQPNEPYVRIGGIDFDSQGNLWITATSTAGNNLLKLDTKGEWETFTLPAVSNKTIGAVLVNSNDDKWVLVPRGNDAYVVSKDGSQKKQLLVTTYFSSGKDEFFTRMNDVYSIAEDKDGAIWIGTSQGVAVYNNPSRIWTTDPFYGSQPGLDLNDGIYHPLLSTETVTAIAVDGANRKWLGTSNSGVFLVSESGEKEVEHFTAENSPLISNTIKSIAINEQSGEVYFGTDKGLVSYMGDANGGNDNYNNVFVYPNPVRETYDGPVTITGLIANTDIKITDIAGNLVYKTTSLGGQAQWDGRNLRGNRVKTGVYLVFCNDKIGEETHIAKLLFIH